MYICRNKKKGKGKEEDEEEKEGAKGKTPKDPFVFRRLVCNANKMIQ